MKLFSVACSCNAGLLGLAVLLSFGSLICSSLLKCSTRSRVVQVVDVGNGVEVGAAITLQELQALCRKQVATK